jgi:hypothetical protein
VAEEPTFTIVDPPRSAFQRKSFLLPFGASAAVALAGAIALFASGAIAMPRIAIVEALMASKASFFADEQVKRILMANRIQVHVTDSGGSLEIAKDEHPHAGGYDFVMPSGQAIGRAVHDSQGGTPFYPFTSPLALGAFREYAKALTNAEVAGKKVAEPQSGSADDALYFTIDMANFIALTNRPDPKTWDDYGVQNTNQVIAQSPDPCRSYSGAAYVGLVAFAANNGQPPAAEDVPTVSAKIRPLLGAEGQHESEMGKKFFGLEGRTYAPVAVIYEHQYLAHQIKTREQTGGLDTDRVLLYPKAHHNTEPWLIAFSKEGEKVGRLLSSDPGLHKRALELGFRPSAGPSSLDELLNERGIPTPQIGDTEAFMPQAPDLAKMIHEVFGCKQIEIPW